MANEVSKIYSDIAELLNLARAKAYHAVNSIMVETYWKIGQRIVEEEQGGSSRAEYGTKLIENLSKYLTDTFGKGFSEANLKNMRQFYLVYPKFDRQCLANLSWSNIARIIRIDNPKERNYYLTEATSQNWSYRQLERNIKSGYYHRLLSTQEASKETSDAEKRLPAIIDTKEFIKDPYVLEFLDLPENIEGKESVLETALINNLQKFLLELGKGFSFVARQFRISTETDHFYADLVFYNYLLKCFVVIDLKTTKLSHADIGQMDMYVRMFDDLKRREDDNPTIGIIFCTDKDETIVKYSVLHESQQIFASKYMTVLPTVEELQKELERNQLIYDSRK